jgi:hypothetical protein
MDIIKSEVMDPDEDETVLVPDAEEPDDPEAKAIMEKLVGKWELVLRVRDWDKPDDPNEHIVHIPNGYVEYMPDGRFGWFDYKTQEYPLYERKYWVDHDLVAIPHWYEGAPPSMKSDRWILHYEKFLVYNEQFECDLEYMYFSDDQIGCNDNYLTFLDEDTIMLYPSSIIFITKDFDIIYKRKY